MKVNLNSPDKRIDGFNEDLSFTVKYRENKSVKDCADQPNYWIKAPCKRHLMILSQIRGIFCARCIQNHHKKDKDGQIHLGPINFQD